MSNHLKTLVLSLLILLPVAFGVSGCISSSSPAPPPSNTTVIVPNQ